MMGVVVLGKLENLIVSTLEGSDEELTLTEIAERVGQSEKKVFKALRKLFNKGIVDSKNRRYMLAQH
jgi:Mn-dependent DtxR family transcriptional regulator